MGQINPYQGIVVPSPRPQGAQTKKDRQGKGRSSQQHGQPAEEKADSADKEGEQRLDVKA